MQRNDLISTSVPETFTVGRTLKGMDILNKLNFYFLHSFVHISSLHAHESDAESAKLLLRQCQLDSKQQGCYVHCERVGRRRRTHLHHQWKQLRHR